MRVRRLLRGERLLERRAGIIPARRLERLPTVEQRVGSGRGGHAADHRTS